MSACYETVYRNIRPGILLEMIRILPYTQLSEMKEVGCHYVRMIWTNNDVIDELNRREDLRYEDLSALLDRKVNLNEMRQLLKISSRIEEIGRVHFALWNTEHSNPTLHLVSYTNNQGSDKVIQESIDHLLQLAGGTNSSRVGWVTGIDEPSLSDIELIDSIIDEVLTTHDKQ